MADVLICGKDPTEIGVLEQLLYVAGVESESLSKMSHIVNSCLRGNHSLVLISLRYGGWEGAEERLEVVRVLHEICPDLPIVVVSDPEDLDTERQLRSLGIFYLLTRPVSVNELKDVVECAMRRQQTDLRYRQT